MLAYILCTILFMIGIYAVVAKKNVIKVIIGLLVIEYAANLMLVLVGYRTGALAPILNRQQVIESSRDVSLMYAGNMYKVFVDPLPQALVLTSIVIGLGTMALMVSMAVRLYEKYKTFDVSLIRKLKG